MNGKPSASQEFVSYNSTLKDRNDNIEWSSSSSGLNDRLYQSLLSESERLVTADVETPNTKAIFFIEDCHKSSPKEGVNADTFGSEIITDISNLSALGDSSNAEINHCRDEIFRRMSESFAACPTDFTEMLATFIDESTLVSSKSENPDIPEVSLNRFTEEFRKICNGYGKRIENDSMPDFGFGLSFDASVTFNKRGSRGENVAGDETATSSLQNFSKLDETRKNNIDSPDSFTTNIGLDSTAMFEFWETLCHKMSPSKRPISSGLLTREDLMRKSDQLMASLEKSQRETDREGMYDSCQKNVSITPKDCRVRSNLTRQTSMETSSSLLANRNDKSNEVLADPNNKQNYNEIQEILTTRIAEKTLSCFETARQASEPEQSATRNKYRKSLDKISECLEENESLSECDDEVTFLSTLSACMDHSNHISEKDRSLLDKCIKRAAENDFIKSASSATIVMPRTMSTNHMSHDGEADYDEEEEDPFEPEPEPVHLLIPISPPKSSIPKSSARYFAGPSSGSHPGKDESLDCGILAITSNYLQLAIRAINKMETILKSHEASSLQTEEDKFISAVNMQLRILQTYPLHSGKADVSKCFGNTLMVILWFYNSGLFGKNVPARQLKELVHQLISLLAENKLDRLNEANAYNRVVNYIVVKVIDHSNHTTIICVLLELLHGCAQSNAPPKYEELVMKCLWKIAKMMPNWDADLDYDTILREVHCFFKDYPTAWWKKRRSDTPLRTVKIVLQSMTRVKGNAILNHLSLITNTDESELYSYLIRLIAVR